MRGERLWNEAYVNARAERKGEARGGFQQINAGCVEYRAAYVELRC